MQREKIEFPTNTPVVLKLDWNDGTLKPGRFGDEYMYVCDDDARIMFVKPELHTLIQQSGARAGDEIAITKREVRDRSRRRSQWEVEKVEQSVEHSEQAQRSRHGLSRAAESWVESRTGAVREIAAVARFPSPESSIVIGCILPRTETVRDENRHAPLSTIARCCCVGGAGA